jgi:hypothetical protein
LRRRDFKFSEGWCKLYWREIWDCEGVEPLFRVPACVVIADKFDSRETDYRIKPDAPFPGEVLSGKLERKNASLSDAVRALTVLKVEFSLNIRGKHSFWSTGEGRKFEVENYYKNRFAEGATISPRSFWFVRVKPSGLGFDPHRPPIETDPRAIKEAKPPYQDMKFQGNVESNFLYGTLLSTDLIPFGHLGYRLVVLPIEPQENHYKLVEVSEASNRGFMHLAQWLKKAEVEWVKRRGSKAGKMTIYERLDRVHALTNQNHQSKFRVLYNTSGTFLTSAVIENEPIEFHINGQRIATQGFVTESVTYHHETQNRDEAFYLAAILNAPTMDRLLKPLQARGLWGPRHFHKKVFEVQIYQFDSKDSKHRQLAELGESCTGKVSQ